MTKLIPVYLVDDDCSARTGLTRLLLSAGYDVYSYASADEMLEAIKSVEETSSTIHGCLILDARMPGSSGNFLCSELKERGFALPVIVVTADDDSRTRQVAMKMHAVGFFRKPVDGPALLDAVKWALQSREWPT